MKKFKWNHKSLQREDHKHFGNAKEEKVFIIGVIVFSSVILSLANFFHIAIIGTAIVGILGIMFHHIYFGVRFEIRSITILLIPISIGAISSGVTIEICKLMFSPDSCFAEHSKNIAYNLIIPNLMVIVYWVLLSELLPKLPNDERIRLDGVRSKLIEFLMHIGNLYIAVVIVFSTFYILLVTLRKYVPLPIFLGVSEALQLTLALSYLVFFLVILLLKWKTRIWVTVLIITIPFFCYIGLFGMFEGEYLEDTARMGERRYHITQEWPLGSDWGHYNFYDCNSLDLGCESRAVGYQSGPRTLVVDSENGLIHAFRARTPDFIYNTLSSEYYFHDHDELVFHDRYVYWVALPDLQKFTDFVVYRCNEEARLDCEILPFRYTTENTAEFSSNDIDYDLLLDDSRQAISFYVNKELIYTYVDQDIFDNVDGCEIGR